MAIVLDNGGALIPYLNLCKFGLGGKQGSGQQMFSWIHIEDVCSMLAFIWAHKELEGVYNAAAPNPVSNETFMATLRKVTGHSIGLPAYAWMLRVGAALLGTETELLLKSRWVLPTKMQQLGFAFKYPVLKDAFEHIVAGLPRRKYHLF
jgi:NAD dependent epimerase/dehydratase family enzyme